jgi:hypothetical protein
MDAWRRQSQSGGGLGDAVPRAPIVATALVMYGDQLDNSLLVCYIVL